MFERFTDPARQVVVLAQDEARALKHNYIGTEHLLLGILREQEGGAGRVLEELGVTVEDVRAHVAGAERGESRRPGRGCLRPGTEVARARDRGPRARRGRASRGRARGGRGVNSRCTGARHVPGTVEREKIVSTPKPKETSMRT